MGEAITLLQRARGAYALQRRLNERRLEKAEPGSDAARAAQHNIDELIGRVRDIIAALRRLGVRDDPQTLPDGLDGGTAAGVLDVRGDDGGTVSDAADQGGGADEEPAVRAGKGRVAKRPPARAGRSKGKAK